MKMNEEMWYKVEKWVDDHGVTLGEGRVLFVPDIEDDVTEGGLIVKPEMAMAEHTSGVIVAVGAGVHDSPTLVRIRFRAYGGAALDLPDGLVAETIHKNDVLLWEDVL